MKRSKGSKVSRTRRGATAKRTRKVNRVSKQTDRGEKLFEEQLEKTIAANAGTDSGSADNG